MLAICLFLGVATLAAIGSLTAGIGEELSRRGQTILGGDVEIAIAQRTATEAEETPVAIEPTPRLPALDPEFLTPLDLPAEDTPEGRLSKWKSKLLDLTLRNRLLNFKPTKVSPMVTAADNSSGLTAIPSCCARRCELA